MSEIIIPIKNFDGNEYIFFPACAYNGNRFNSLKKMYPPSFTHDEAIVDMPVTITDVPRLNIDGSGAIEVTTGDVSVPCMGMFSKERKSGMLVFTVQQVNNKNLGLTYSNGEFKISSPNNRKNIYIWPFMKENPDYCAEKSEETDEFDYKVLEFPCADIKSFYNVFFENRKIMGMDSQNPVNLSEDEQWQIQRTKFNAINYNPLWGYNLIATHERQAFGWCNSPLASYAMMKLGDEVECQRSEASLDYIFKVQAESGFLPGMVNREGVSLGDGFGNEGTQNRLLIRRAADVLYFVFKHFDLYKERGIDIPQKFVEGTRKLADAFVKLWEKYGQLGQLVDYKTGDIIVGGSTCGALVPAALARAYTFFDDIVYLHTAEKIAMQYYNRDALNGYTTGGPAEILQCPDSESAFSLLESMVVLYETTNDKNWLEYAEFMAHFCSSWVVSYNYKFPEECEFARLGIKTVGTVFANIQNKHSAPGICTLSGDSLYKLYKLTNNNDYLELIIDIKKAISQCMSTEERPIYSWALPKDPTLNPDGEPCPSEKLPPGTICERVNMSDWETRACIGGVFNGSCWSEISNLLTLAELPDKLFKM